MNHTQPINLDNTDYQRRLLKMFVPILAVLIVGGGIAGATQWAPRQGCEHRITHNQTLTGISRTTGTPVDDMVQVNPHVTNPDQIRAGDWLDVCKPDTEQPRHGLLVPARLIEWAAAVDATRPDWASDQDAVFLTVVSGPESNHGGSIWNPNDASADGKWTGSYGFIQIRTLAHPERFPSDWYRDRAWLEESLENQATAAWIVLRDQSRESWGPVTDGKLPSESCAGSSNVERCQNWWAMGLAAIDYAALPGSAS